MSQSKIVPLASFPSGLTYLFSFILVEVTRSLQWWRANYAQAGKGVVVIYTSRTIKPLHRAAANSPMNSYYGDLVLMDAFNWLRYTPARLLALIGFAVNKPKIGSKASSRNQGNQFRFFFSKRTWPSKTKHRCPMFRVQLYEVRVMQNKTHISNYNRLFSKFFYSMLHFKQICQEQL